MMNNKKWQALWLYGVIAVCVLLVAATLASIGPFNLRNESNFAALWSGMLLLLVAIHAFDGRAQHRTDNPVVGRAWLIISLILVTLSFDEIGSFHERLPSETHLQYWLWVLPFALIYACAAAYALVVLYRSEQYRSSAKLIGLGFLLFASVALQEEIEWRLFDVEWRLFEVRLPRILRLIRAAIEEGTELLGMILLLKASMINTRGLLSRYGESAFPTFEAVLAWRIPILILGLVGAPLIAFFTVSLPLDPWGHGIPADWPPVAMFTLAAFAVIRPFLSGEGRVGWSGWVLAGICLVGCASTTYIVGPDKVQVLMGVISASAGLIWILDSRYLPRIYVPAIIFLASALAVSWVFSESDFIRYSLIQYVALGVYYVCSAPAAAKAGPTP